MSYSHTYRVIGLCLGLSVATYPYLSTIFDEKTACRLICLALGSDLWTLSVNACESHGRGLESDLCGVGRGPCPGPYLGLDRVYPGRDPALNL